MKRLVLFLATIVAAVSCNNEIAEAPKMEAATKKISVAVAANSASDANTRVDFADDGKKGYAVTWNAADQLGAWSTVDGANEQSLFEIKDGNYDANNSIFEGEVYDSGDEQYDELRFLHPYNADLEKSGTQIRLSLENQSVGAGLSHMSANTYMISDEFDATTEQISMTHIGAAIELKMKFAADVTESDYTLTKVIVSGDDSYKIPVGGKVSISTGKFTAESFRNIVLETSDIEAVNDIYTIPFNIFPFNIENGASLNIEAIFESKSNNMPYSATATITNNGEVVEFKRATKNTVYAKLGELKASEVTTSVTYDSTLEAMGKTTADVSDGAGLEVKDAKFDYFTLTSDKGVATTVFRLWKNGSKISSYVGNTVTLTAVDGMAITGVTFDSSKITAVAGTSKEEANTWSGNASAVIFTLAKGTNSEINVTTAAANSETEDLSEIIVPTASGSAADLLATEDGTEFTLEDAYIDNISGSYVYVNTNGVSAQIYQYQFKGEVGQTVTIVGSVSTYNGAKQLKNVTSVTESTTKGTPVTAKELTVAEYMANYKTYYAQYISLKDVTVTNNEISQNDSTTSYDNRFKLTIPYDSFTCDLCGYAGVQGSIAKIYPVSFDNVVENEVVTKPAGDMFTADNIRADLGEGKSINLTNKTYTVGDTIIGFEKGTSTNSAGAHMSYTPLRTYAGAQLRFTSKKSIARIVVTTSSSVGSNFVDYTTGEAGDALTQVSGTTDYEWTGSSKELVLKNIDTKQIKWSSIEVYYAE